MTLSVPDVPASCEKFSHSSQLNFWSTEPIFNQFSVFLKTLNALCVCLQSKHPRSMKRVIRSDKLITLLLLLWSHKCDFGAEPRSRIIATSAVKGLSSSSYLLIDQQCCCLDAGKPDKLQRCSLQTDCSGWRSNFWRSAIFAGMWS
jgi:hypothetical protein